MTHEIRTVMDRDHAPAYLREMFCEALAHRGECGIWWEWFTAGRADHLLGQQREGSDWTNLDSKGRARWLIHRLWYSREIVPEILLASLGLSPGQTYAQVARRAHRDVSDELPVVWRPPASSGAMQSDLPSGATDHPARAASRRGMTGRESPRRARIAWRSGQADRARGDS